MIAEENGVFHIRTETYSYLFKIDAYGLPEHLHFGAPVKTRDAGALSCRPGLGWGASILLDAKDTAHNIGHFPYWKFSFSNLENTDFLI